ncbi:MAG: DUF1830 domain-containing protein [cyanobacterium endosymbiont of Rhopalodia sterrenbergii]
MDQILDSLPTGQRNIISCCYVNATSQIQVVRITNVPNWYFERVVFPGQRLMFKAVPQALLEIHTGAMASSILSDTIPCERLSLNKENYEEINKQNIAVCVQTVNNISIEANENYTQNQSSFFRLTLV